MTQGTALIYMHIPKSGGTTLNTILQRNFQRCYFVNPRNVLQSKAELRGWSEAARGRIDLLHGHLSYGWHELLPRKALYVTIVRHPVARVVSHYNYVRFHPTHRHYLRDVVEREEMTLADYVQSGVCDEVNNGQVRLLSGVEDIVQQPYPESAVPYGSNDRGLSARAIDNMDSHFAVVGLQERFDASLVLLKSALGIRKICYEAQNVGGRHYTKVRPTAAEVGVIERYNRLDIALYRHAVRRFERDFVNVDLANIRVKMFQVGNRIYGRARVAKGKLQNLA